VAVWWGLCTNTWYFDFGDIPALVYGAGHEHSTSTVDCSRLQSIAQHDARIHLILAVRSGALA